MKGFGNNEIKKSFSANEVVREKFKKEAFEAYQRGNINYAIQCFENCIKNGFHDPKFFSQYGIILYKSGFITKAINILEQSILIYPNETELFINLGNIFKLIGDFKKAEKYIKKSYELSPKSSTVLTNLSSIYIEQKKLYDARKFALLSHKADLNKPEPLYNLGIIYSKLYFYKEASFYFKETLKRDKKSYPANLNLGAVLLKLDRLDEAQKYLNVATMQRSDDVRALFEDGSDGAIVVNRNGQIIGGKIYLTVDSPSSEVPEGCGTRHISAASFSQREDVISVFTLSEETYVVRSWKDGEYVEQFSPEELDRE